MPDRKKDQFPMVRVLWVDAESGGDNWETEEVSMAWARGGLTGGDTVGRLVHKTRDYVVVYATVLGKTNWLHGLKIPRRYIKEIRYLDER